MAGLATIWTQGDATIEPGATVLAPALLGPRATTQQVAHYNQMYGFDRPFYIQYIKWVGQILHGNLGLSFTFFPAPVSQIIGQALPGFEGVPVCSKLKQ